MDIYYHGKKQKAAMQVTYGISLFAEGPSWFQRYLSANAPDGNLGFHGLLNSLVKKNIPVLLIETWLKFQASVQNNSKLASLRMQGSVLTRRCCQNTFLSNQILIIRACYTIQIEGVLTTNDFSGQNSVTSSSTAQGK